jgi:replication factor C large subunit
MWTEKYKPLRAEDVLGNPKVTEDLKKYNWKTPVILYGPPGCGKSVLAKALANESGYDIVEINDDNIKNGKTIAESSSLFGNRKLIVFDNADNIDDIGEVSDILKITKNPTILITSDFESKRLATAKKLCEKFQMRRPSPVSVAKLLESIAAKEGIEADKELLKEIAEKSEGDFRAAVNDLETLASGRKKIVKEDLSILEGRDRVSDIYKALSTIFLKKDIQESQRSTYDLDEQPQNVLLWIDENLPSFVKGPQEISRCYDYLSRSDIFMGRIMSRQYWGYLRYAGTLMTSGVTASKGDKVSFNVRYQFPFYIIRMGQTKKERNLKKSIGKKMGPRLHCSSKDVANSYIPLYRTLIQAKKVEAKTLGEEFKLEKEEMEYLL